MSVGYSIETAGNVALVAATAKTILGVVAAAGVTTRLVELGLSFDGVAAAAVPVLVELCRGTGATAGTATAQVVQQLRSATRTPQCTGAVNYSAEPTVLAVLKRWRVHPQTSMRMQFPLGREVVHTGAGGLFLRLTAAAVVNATADMEFEEG